MPSRKNKNQDSESQKPQRLNWKQNKRYKTYDEANKKREDLVTAGEKYVKVRRCGPGGTQFKVVVGTLVEAKVKKSKTTRQKEGKSNDTK